MRTLILATLLVGAGACAFPGVDPGTDSSSAGVGGGVFDPTSGGAGSDPSSGAGGSGSVFAGTFELAAYQATGTIDGRPATISRGAISFGSSPGELATAGDCYGIRLRQGERLEAALNAGTVHIDGAKQDYSCRWANGAYSCDLPTNDTFFTPGANLGVTIEGSDAMQGESFSGVVPPRAPVPQVALDAVFGETQPVTIRWQPDRSLNPAQMTCLNLESLDESGEVTGFVQCDVDDSQGETTVPVEMVQMLDPTSPRLRATLYSANAGGSFDAFVTFGSGRFVEVHR